MSRSRIDVDDLIGLVPPPERLVDRVPWERWPEIEQELGTPLPRDYKLILTTYGAGEFNGFFGLFHPLGQSDSGNLIRQARREVFDGLEPHLLMYEESRVIFPEVCTLPSYPEPGGLLPLGGDINGGSAFWLTRGEPDDWSLVFYPHGFWQVEEQPFALAGFLVLWIAGELPGCFFGAGGRSANRTDPAFRNRAER